MKKPIINIIFILFMMLLFHHHTEAQTVKEILLKGLKEKNILELQRLSKQKLEAEDKLILKAYFTQNGDSAAGFYEEMLSAYPESIYAEFAQQRMNEYNFINDFVYTPAVRLPDNSMPLMDTTANASSPSLSQPQKQEPISKPEVPNPIVSSPKVTETPAKPPVSIETSKASLKTETTPPKSTQSFRLQFGSFKEKRGAERFAELMKIHQVRIFEEKDTKNNILFKVKSQKSYQSREEAKAEAEKIPYQSFVVSDED
ncbi:MAG: SPOR domain-containing protein [Chloroherpetonaceae bacterium]|nr:SPOR domain-containing protein [Chloroherpetonaceae bacterium]